VALDNNLTLRATQLPPGEFGFFVAGQIQGMTPNLAGTQGTFCLDIPFARLNASLANTEAAGELTYSVDLTSIPMTPPVAAMVGETWRFQCWYRDVNPNPTANLTDGWLVTFQ